MGDMADMLLDGTCDEQTGEYIGQPVGYPRTMQKDCYNTMQRKDNPTKGVLNFLRNKGHVKKKEQTEIIRKFLTSIDVESSNLSKVKMCETISKDFGKFIKFLHTIN